MDIQQWEIDTILWFQDHGEWLEPIMQFFTLLGFPQTYVLLVAILYWSVDSRLGQRFAIFVLFTGAVNEILKRLLHSPRPYWIDSRVRPIGSVSTSFGLPSGHAQSSVVWIFIGDAMKKWWGWVLSLFVIMMIGLSRIYLGAHSPVQVGTGWVMGGLFMFVCMRFERPFMEWIAAKPVVQQLLIVTSITLVLLLIGYGSVVLLNDWEIPELWSQNVALHLEEGESFEPRGFEPIAITCAALLGTGVGSILMNHFGGHSAGGTWKMRVLRTLVGSIALIFLLFLLTILGEFAGISDDQVLLNGSWRSISAFLILFVIFCPIPLLFQRIGLADTPE